MCEDKDLKKQTDKYDKINNSAASKNIDSENAPGWNDVSPDTEHNDPKNKH